MSKDTKIISDQRSFFAKNDDNRAIKCIIGVMEHINIRSSQRWATEVAYKDCKIQYSVECPLA